MAGCYFHPWSNTAKLIIVLDCYDSTYLVDNLNQRMRMRKNGREGKRWGSERMGGKGEGKGSGGKERERGGGEEEEEKWGDRKGGKGRGREERREGRGNAVN